MFSDLSLQVLYRITNAPVRQFPYPHILVRDVFPAAFYRDIRAHLPPKELFTTLAALGRVSSGGYPARFVLPMDADRPNALPEPLGSFWNDVCQWLLGPDFGSMILGKFGDALVERLGDPGKRSFRDEAMLVQDYTTYSLGPHTDNPRKAVSFLFYLPADDARPDLGTSVYVPKDPQFTCKGGPHHPFKDFHRVCTMPYLANTLFAFPKTLNSFHGVEPIADADVRRDLLLYDIMVDNPPELAENTQEHAATTAPRLIF